MKTSYRIILLALVAAGAFFAGSWVTYYQGNHKSPSERKILYYVDPMNPAFKSAKPGIAPCGMPLEPVYAEKDNRDASGSVKSMPMPPGTIRIMQEKQQLIGVRLLKVEKLPWSSSIRVLGKVIPDETRVYRINAAVGGLIKNALPVTTGSLVKENELLATFYSSQEYRALVQSYFNAMKLVKSGSWSPENTESTRTFSKSQLAQLKKISRDLGQTGEAYQIDYYRRNILNYGIGLRQLEEMERTGEIPEEIEIRSPAAGFVVLRNITADYRFDKGTELFRIADLSRVWILADVFEYEASSFKPGLTVKMELPYQRKTFTARMSNVLPQFDPATRTLKIRLEADNPGYSLRPDMFVNVEIPVSGPAAFIVPADAVVDSGLKKTIFVDRGNGYFEPRQVETGRSLGDRVEITHGLMSGETIVISGNFLMDSESRMQQAGLPIAGKAGRDPVCLMNIDEVQARMKGHLVPYKGQTYFFCSPECRDEFVKMPGKFTASTSQSGSKSSLESREDSVLKHSKNHSMKNKNISDAKREPHNHESMRDKSPHISGHSGSADSTLTIQREKMSDMSAPFTDRTQRMSSGRGAGMADDNKLSTVPQLPPPSSMPPMQGGKVPDAFNTRIQQPQGSEKINIMPGAPPSLNPLEPTVPRKGRMPGFPPGKMPSDSAIMSDEKANCLMPGANDQPVISPGESRQTQGPQTQVTGDGQNHD